MTISPETEAQILRYYHAERWRIGTIATQLCVHHGTVLRVLTQAGLPRTGIAPRASRIDPYLTVIALAATPDDERRSELGSGGKRSRNILTV